MAGVTFHPNQRELDALTSSRGIVGRAVENAAGKARDEVKKSITAVNAIDTGAMRNSVTARKKTETPTRVIYEVGPRVPYALAVNNGVGPVVPRTSRVLRFKPKGASDYVFTKRTRGFRGRKFMESALRRVTKEFFRA